MNKILVVSFSNLYSDPRVNRQINFLKDKYEVHTIGFADSRINGVKHYNVTNKPKKLMDKLYHALKLFFGFYKNYYNGFLHISETKEILKQNNFNLILANDIDSLPVVIENRKNAKVVFDAHEYSPREFEDKLTWRIFFKKYKEYLCATYIPKVDNMITVCNGIANEYYKNYNVLPVVITNAPSHMKYLQPHRVNNDKIKIIHHGVAMDSRKIELMIETMRYVDNRFELYLMLVPAQPKYFQYLKNCTNDMNNVFFINTVPMREISEHINKYDVGFYILEPNSFNNKYALPNKLFEFIQARLAVAIGPSLEMASVVQKYNIGVVGNTFCPIDMANMLNGLSVDKIFEYKINSDKAASILCAEENMKILQNIIDKVMN